MNKPRPNLMLYSDWRKDLPAGKHHRCAGEQMKRFITIIVCLVVFAASHPASPSDQSVEEMPWIKILDFSILSNDHGYKADLGNHTILSANWVSDLGWTIEIFTYPVTDESLNLLYDGNNWHGIQPWDVFAWTKHMNTYPDERVVTYQKGKSQIRIVLINCETQKIADNSYEFIKGSVVVYHRGK
jgi:hypothetical protein